MEEIFRKRLHEELINNHITTSALAKKVGVSPEMITQYYTTKKLPKLDTFIRICEALGVTPNYLLGFSDV